VWGGVGGLFADAWYIGGFFPYILEDDEWLRVVAIGCHYPMFAHPYLIKLNIRNF
jgi:hypothetical protein